MRLAAAISATLFACTGGAALVPPDSSGGTSQPDASAAPATDASTKDAPAVHAVASSELCKLLSNRNTSDPTPNDVQHRANMLGADLGIPVVHGDQLYLFFGDTLGYAGIWGATESHPDAIGYATDSAATLAAQPNLLCSDLRIVSLPAAQSIGPQVDPTVQADFAGAAMTAPAGGALADYIHNPAGGANGTTFPYLPGDFEVPSGAFSTADAIYVFYTTVVSPGDAEMKASYLVRWSQPSPSGPPSDQILYGVDERFDGSGALGGNFINISAEVSGDYVYLFGTGAYRASGIAVARKRLDALATPGGFEQLGTIITTPGYGETSVRYFPEVDRWVLLAEESLPASNRIVAYTAQDPAGPWSAPIIVHDMADPTFRQTYCCATDDDCTAPQMFDCDRTGFYGTYLLPNVTTSGNSFTVTYTMSSFAPYNVALFQTTFSE
jgi:hypothetical protein